MKSLQVIFSKERSLFLQTVIGFIVAFGLFSNTLNHDYAWDDRIVITENPYVLSGLDGLGEIWVKQHSDLLHDQIGYRPVTLTTFALEQHFAPNNPKVGHFLNVLIYGLLIIVVLFFIRSVFGVKDNLMTLLVVLVFASHPLHVEVVANIKSRDEMLQLLFGLLSVISFKQWLRAGNFILVISTILTLMLSVLSKENGITSVGVMGLVWVVSKQPFKIDRSFVFSSLLLTILAMSSVWIISQGLSGNEESVKTEGLGVFYESPVLGDCFRQTDDHQVLLANKNLLLFRYIGKFFYPVGLTYYSGFDQIPLFGAWSVESILGFIGTLVVLLLWGYSYRAAPKVFLGFGFFLITLSPYLHLVRPMPDTMADRYMFGPSLGLAVCFGLVLTSIADRISNNQELKVRGVAGLGLACVLLLGAGTWHRNKVWQDNLTLFSSDIGKLEGCAKAHEYYADALHVQLDKSRDASLVTDIVEHYERSIEISELSYYSFIKLGSNYAQWGNAARGIELLERAVELFPLQADPHFYLGNAYYHAGRFKEAAPEFQKSIEYSPAVSDSYYLLCRVYLGLNSLEQAEGLAISAIEKFPTDLYLRDVLVDLELERGDADAAFAQLDTILRIEPNAIAFWKKAIGLRQQLGMNFQADSIYLSALSNGVVFSD